MGWASSLEDAVERYIESGPASEVLPTRQKAVVRPSPRVIYCPLCPESFLDEDVLESHVAATHGGQHVYLKVNGRIVRDICWTAQPLNECKMVLLRIPELMVTIDVQGKASERVLRGTVSLKSHLQPIPQEGRILVRTGDPFPRTFTIYLGRQPAFEAKRLDSPLTGLMQKLRQGAVVDLIDFRSRLAPTGLNELETRYWEGVLEYCHAWQLEARGDHRLSKGRLECSMELLMPFKTALADEIRHALSLKMNCFAGQWGCDAGSPFLPAERFFCPQASQGEGSVLTRELTIPLDSVSHRILDAITAYHEEDSVGVLGILLELRKGSPLRGRNDEDKLALLEARTRNRMGDKRGAAGVYESLADHPVFGAEASLQLGLVAAP